MIGELQMLFNYILGIYCFECKKYLDPYTEVYHNFLYEGSITCEKEHLVGNVWDLEWEIFTGGTDNE